jgi:hypothetical protein
LASGELAAAVARRGCRAVRNGRAEPMTLPGVSPAGGLCSLAAVTHADLVVAGSAWWHRACRCPVLVLSESQEVALDRAPRADREDAT